MVQMVRDPIITYKETKEMDYLKSVYIVIGVVILLYILTKL